ncbi:MAG: cyclic lactone autoinducer peptide [Eubacterium sp.]|nr:cyclic lactone autoinducer peptide [Eubacterium sp.]
MKQKKQGRSFAGTVVNLLNTSLTVDANTTSCAYFYQPEAPKELSRFKKSK